MRPGQSLQSFQVVAVGLELADEPAWRQLQRIVITRAQGFFPRAGLEPAHVALRADDRQAAFAMVTHGGLRHTSGTQT